MRFKHKDFLSATGLPKGIDLSPGIKDCYAFAIDDGPVLVGPVAVDVKVQDNPDEPAFGGHYIQVGGTRYWSDYGGENKWGESGYYLNFATPEQIAADPEHVLVNEVADIYDPRDVTTLGGYPSL